MYDVRVLLVCCSRIEASFPGLSMAMILDCLHTLGLLFSVKHMFSIECNHMCAFGPICCSTSTSSMPAALLFLSVATHCKQHRCKGVPPNGSPCANNHCSTRYEQSFRHNKHTYTYQEAATDQDTRHNH